jgi:putative endonuclease
MKTAGVRIRVKLGHGGLLMKRRTYFVYILSNNHGVLYVGVTNDLRRRIHQHRTGESLGFTSRYHVGRLLYWEDTPDIRCAIAREKEIKSWRREKKLALIRTVNPRFRDLAEDPDW